MTCSIARKALLGLVAFGLAVTPALTAQQPAPDEAELPELNEETLVNFAEAYLDVTGIVERLETAIAQAADAEEAEQLRAQANEEMDAAAESWGFTPAQYRAISSALNRDEELLERFHPILARVKEERAKRDT